MRRRRGPAGSGVLACFVTSHGFGHSHRTAAVVNQIPRDVRVIVLSHSDLFGAWRQRLTRPADLVEHVSDAGVVNPPGDSSGTDFGATLDRAWRVHAAALEGVERDADWMRAEGIAAVLCDVPAVPLLAARRAGVPGFLLANFTWADIYHSSLRGVGGERDRKLIASLRQAYRQAELVFRIEPALRMSWLARQRNVGLIAHQGRNRRDELRRLLGLGRRERLVYFYVGRYGQNDLDWERMQRYAGQGVHFVGYHPPPVGPLVNFHQVSPEAWHGGDLSASADVILAKAGYGTVAEAMACGTPIIYPPRRGFAEFRALDRGLRGWGGGIPVSSREFRSMRLDRALATALASVCPPSPYPTDGALRVAAFLTRRCRGQPLNRGDEWARD